METIQSVQKKLKTAGDLLSVVRTMKSLASVNIRGYERAAKALDLYEEVVLLAWTAFLRSGGSLRAGTASGPTVILTIGSDQGMCGQFNDAAAQLAVEEARVLESEGGPGGTVFVWSMGERVSGALESLGRESAMRLTLPGSLSDIDLRARQVLERVEEWQRDGRLGSLTLAHNSLGGRGSFQPGVRRLLPLDRKWADGLTERTWPTRALPMLALPPDELTRFLFAEYLYVSLHRAMAQSLAAESSARLASMQNAEKNIRETREDLTGLYRQTRQTAITSELLDIVSGFTALEEAE